MNEIAKVVTTAKEMKQVMDAPAVIKHLSTMYTRLYGGSGEAKFEAEKHAFLRTLQDNPALKDCSPISLYGCFVDAIVQNLTFTGNLVYLIPYGKTAKLSLSPYGEVSLRILNGHLRHVDNPVLVYEGDSFKVVNGRPLHQAVLPRKEGSKAIACYVRMVLADGSESYHVMTIGEVMGLKKYSKMPKLYGNAEDGSNIDLGFFKAKVLKHAMKALPKIDLRGSKFVQVPDEVEEVDYGMDVDSTPEHNEPTIDRGEQDDDVPF